MNKMCNKTAIIQNGRGLVSPVITTKNGKASNGDGVITPKPKEKRRNNEKRKEKSRDAARCRRSRETEIFTELAEVLPLRRDDVEQLDKASVMRLAISYLKVRNMLVLFPNSQKLEEITDAPLNDVKPIYIPKSMEVQKLLQSALDGFLLIVSSDGDVTYVSDNIAEFLGLAQIDVMGQPIWEYSHQCDHSEFRDALNVKRGDDQTDLHRDFFLRFKCTLTSRGRSVNIKSASYKVIHVTGHIACDDEGNRQLIAIGRPLPHPSNIEVPLDSTTFLTKHSLDMKFSYVDDNMLNLLGYEPEHLMDTSLYSCHHGGDSEGLMQTFKTVIAKGQAETNRYRFLARCGGYVWCVTQASIVYDKQKPQSVVCVHYILSEIENKNDIYSIEQLEARQSLPAATAIVEPSVAEKLCKQEVHKQLPITLNTDNNKPKGVEKINELVNEVKHQPQQQQALPVERQQQTVVSKKTDLTSGVVIDNSNPRPRSVTASVFVAGGSASVAPIVSNNSTNTECSSVVTSSLPKAVTASVFTPIYTISEVIQQQQQQQLLSQPNQQQPHRPKPATANIFVPRTDDMNKGFLMFSDDGPEMTMLKEEPDDLTHLAPTAGDACIPLDEAAPLFGEMFDGLILPLNYALLSDDINSLDSTQSHASMTGCGGSSNIDKHSNKHIDPFISYRDESSETSGSPNILSPGGMSKSPAGSSLPSLCSPNSLSQEDEFAFMNVDDEIDLSMRAPYIPMSENDDLPLLTEDLMWSAFTDDLSLHKDINTITNESMKSINNGGSTMMNDSSSLAALLQAHNNNNIHLNESLNNNHSNNNDILQGNSMIAVFRCQDSDDGSIVDMQQCKRNGLNIDHGGGGELAVNPVEVMGMYKQQNCSWTMNDLLQLNTTPSTATATSIQLSTPASSPPTLSTPTTPKSSNRTEIPSSKKQSQEKQHTNHKRPSPHMDTTNTPTTSKRAKAAMLMQSSSSSSQSSNSLYTNSSPSNTSMSSSSSTSTSASSSAASSPSSAPQLLQQLMAPTPQRARSKQLGGINGLTKAQTTNQWCLDGSEKNNLLAQQHASNSVLKNLLEPFSMKPPDVLLQDSQAVVPVKPDPMDSSAECVARGRMKRLVGNPLICGIIKQLPPSLNEPDPKVVIVCSERSNLPNEEFTLQRSAFAKYVAPSANTINNITPVGRGKLLQKRDSLDFLNIGNVDNNEDSIWMDDLNGDDFEIANAINDVPMQMEYEDDAWAQSD